MESQSGLTLTQLAYYGRLFIKFGIVALITLTVGKTFLSAATSYWAATHPAPPPPPTVGFGALPPLRFPAQTASDKPSSYQLQTASGQFPRFKDRAKVFYMPKASLDLLADQKAKEAAANLGYLSAPIILNQRTYRWTKAQPLQSTLEMDLQNSDFSITTNYMSVPELFSNKNLPDADTAVSTVRSFIANGVTLGADIATMSGQTSFLKSFGSDITPAVSVSDANLVEVNIQRPPIDSIYPLFTTKGREGIIHAVLSGGLTGNDQIVELEYRYHPVDYTQPETYPIRSVQSAWQTLQAGQGFIVNKGNTSTATIRNVGIGYYDDFQEQDYLQPIYIFVGDGGFIGYVPAVDPRYIQSSTAQPSTSP